MQKLKQNLKDVMVHDIEVAAFIIVSISLFATLTSYALDVSDTKVKDTSKTVKRDPVAVALQDVSGDGLKDIVLVHRDGSREVVITENR